MRIRIPCTALGLALAVGAPAAHAETIVTRQIVNQPVETVRTVTVTRTTRPIRHHRVVETRRTTVNERSAVVAPVIATRPIYGAVAPAPVVRAPYPRAVYDVFPPAPPPPVAAYPRPVYDVVAPAPPPPVAGPYPRPVYDVAAPAPAPAPAVVEPIADETVVGPGAPLPPDAVAPPMPTYHYVYEWDRILVIDDATGIAVQALPR